MTADAIDCCTCVVKIGTIKEMAQRMANMMVNCLLNQKLTKIQRCDPVEIWFLYIIYKKLLPI
ncbi:hypothetical protein [Aquisediminimonas sediminicola]|uniref:hypothetical protein n=1 Tax=Alteraquisediminimonas sediminicola TaxID=2676787 RepID=UPI001C8E633C|nr:hypothetical protein [Aquisediminimonas sediminicola]